MYYYFKIIYNPSPAENKETKISPRKNPCATFFVPAGFTTISVLIYMYLQNIHYFNDNESIYGR